MHGPILNGVAMEDTRYDDAGVSAEAMASLRPGFKPLICMVTGSGFGALVDLLDDQMVTPYEEIEGFLALGVSGHAGNLVTGFVKGVPVAVLHGRPHLFEGYSVSQVVHPMRAMACWGVKALILTNASGAVSQRLHIGRPMIIRDHINESGSDPFEGPYDERLGPDRFLSPAHVYSLALQDYLGRAFETLSIQYHEGVYMSVKGPTFETPAEGRRQAAMGADATGMSTVNEALAAMGMGMSILGISGLANWVNGCAPSEAEAGAEHASVLQIVEGIATEIAPAIKQVIPEIASLLGGP